MGNKNQLKTGDLAILWMKQGTDRFQSMYILYRTETLQSKNN